MAGFLHYVLTGYSAIQLSIPKREWEGGPGRKKSILPKKASFISPPNSWHSSLLNQIRGGTVTFPIPYSTRAMLGSMGSVSFPHTPASLLSSSVFPQKATLPAQTSSPWVVVAQPPPTSPIRSWLFLIYSLHLTPQTGTERTPSQSEHFSELILEGRRRQHIPSLPPRPSGPHNPRPGHKPNSCDANSPCVPLLPPRAQGLLSLPPPFIPSHLHGHKGGSCSANACIQTAGSNSCTLASPPRSHTSPLFLPLHPSVLLVGCYSGNCNANPHPCPGGSHTTHA